MPQPKMFYGVDVTLTIQFPALDALVAYLTSAEQAKVDAAVAKIKANTAKVQTAVDANTVSLEPAIPPKIMP